LREANQGLIHGLDARPEIPDLAFLTQFTQPLENLTLAHYLSRNAMKLDEINCLDPEPSERRLDGSPHSRLSVFVRIQVRHAAEFRGNEDLLGTLPQEASDQTLA